MGTRRWGQGEDWRWEQGEDWRWEQGEDWRWEQGEDWRWEQGEDWRWEQGEDWRWEQGEGWRWEQGEGWRWEQGEDWRWEGRGGGNRHHLLPPNPPGVVEDILLVPVGISYDVLVERNFVRHELMVSGLLEEGSHVLSHACHMQGGSKRPETLCQALRGVWTMLTRNTGSIRVDFAQPFSLQVSLCLLCCANGCGLVLVGVAWC